MASSTRTTLSISTLSSPSSSPSSPKAMHQSEREGTREGLREARGKGREGDIIDGSTTHRADQSSHPNPNPDNPNPQHNKIRTNGAHGSGSRLGRHRSDNQSWYIASFRTEDSPRRHKITKNACTTLCFQQLAKPLRAVTRCIGRDCRGVRFSMLALRKL